MAKELKLKALAKEFGLTEKALAEELLGQGITVDKKRGVISGELVDLVEDYLRETHPAAGEKAAEESPSSAKTLQLKTPVIVKDLAEALGKRPNEVISALMKMGELASVNQSVSDATAKKLCKGLGFNVEFGKAEPKAGAEHTAAVDPFADTPDDPKKLKPRPPVVTFLGHVDHGKTSLQDAIRHTDVVTHEAGRITQHIGASTINYKGKTITFIDTPGHEAFTSMRARGANATDIAILVVSATEGFKPQTVEAMNHALAAKVPIVVAMNKMDLPDADPNKVLLHMQQNNLMSEEWGGEVGTVKVSAKTGAGLPDLIERILLEAEMLDLKANPDCPARAVVLESQVEQGLGSTASVLVQKGTLKVGDFILCGQSYGRVKTLINDKGARVKNAGPSIPVKVVGLNEAPDAGAQLIVCDSERTARQEAERRIAEARDSRGAHSAITSVEDLFSKLGSAEHHTLNLIVKTDVRGSGEAIAQSLAKLPSEKISSEILLNSVGSITENDVMLAAASSAIIVGFHVRVNPGVSELAKKQNVDIRLYSIIYELLEDISDALAGRLDPEKREKSIGHASILKIFELSKGPKICGCMVDDGVVHVGAKARVRRDGNLIYNGSVASLRRFQDDVKEVKAGLECGIRLDNFNDFEVGDKIECYDIEFKKATL